MRTADFITSQFNDNICLAIMATNKSNISSLRRQINSNMIADETGTRHFLPTIAISTILTQSAISDAVDEMGLGPENVIGLVDTIHRDGQRVFAILLSMGEQDSICKFRNHGALDSRLPLSEKEAVDIAPSFGGAFANDFQWKLLSRHLPHMMWENHHEFRDQDILPFVGKPTFLDQGAFGEIYMINVLASQQNLFPVTVSYSSDIHGSLTRTA